MKYQAPAQGHYESGLTAKLMYDQVKNLIKNHATFEDGKRLRNEPSLGLGKLWDKPKIRSELEEFIASYLLDDLQTPLPNFGEIFIREGSLITIKEENLENYIARLEQQYNSRGEIYKIISGLFDQIKKRKKRLYEEIDKIGNLKENQLVKMNARDSFAHISMIYELLELEMEKTGIQS